MRYIKRTITKKTATATLYDGSGIITKEIDVSSCRMNDKIIKKFIEKKTNMKVLKFEIKQQEELYRMSVDDFIQNAEIVK